MMQKQIVSEETKNQVFTMWMTTKNKTEIERKLGLCRKKIKEIIHSIEHGNYFDVKKEKNWLIND